MDEGKHSASYRVILKHMDEALLEEEGGKERVKSSKVNPIGRTIYGERFVSFDRVAQLADFLPSFKEYYYTEKIKDFRKTGGEIIREFNEGVCYPQNRTFFPYTNQYKGWRAKWDRDILEKKRVGGLELIEQKQVLQIIKSRNEDNDVVLGAPKDEDLEAGTRTLAGELTNDALQMLRDDQALEEIYTSEELMRRRSYIVNVFSHVTKLVHGKAALMLKASQEKRENAGFLMNLLARASAGNMTDEELGLLETAYVPKQNGQQQPAQL